MFLTFVFWVRCDVALQSTVLCTIQFYRKGKGIFLCCLSKSSNGTKKYKMVNDPLLVIFVES